MGKVTGFKEFDRAVEPYRPPKNRILDFKEIYTDHDEPLLGCLLYTSPSPRD